MSGSFGEFQFGTFPVTPDEWWPILRMDEYADFSYDATADVTVNGTIDPIVGLSFLAMPSGANEVVASRLTLTNSTLITVWLTGGVPGRVYTYLLLITTTAGRILPINIGQVCDPLYALSPVPPAPTPGFGPAISWP
jgi:hypothetical protein